MFADDLGLGTFSLDLDPGGLVEALGWKSVGVAFAGTQGDGVQTET